VTKIESIASVMQEAALANPNLEYRQRVKVRNRQYEVWLCYRSSPEGAAWHLGVFSQRKAVDDGQAGTIALAFFGGRAYEELVLSDDLLAHYPEAARRVVKDGLQRQFVAAA
jgi:hypothetical protein